MSAASQLRKRFEKDDIVRIVGAHNPLSAKVAERCGFDGIWSSGFEISTSFAVPDANILSMSDYLEIARHMAEAVSIPIVADCDTGYGNIHNVMQAVKKFEGAGVAAICIEDKRFPKVNSFVPGRQDLVSIEEFAGKVEAAKSAQRSKDFMVIARVEALIAGCEMGEALARAQAYADAGADAVLMHSKAKTSEHIVEFCKKWDFRKPVVVVPTTYYQTDFKQLEKLGVKMAIYANHGVRAEITALENTFKEIIKTGSSESVEGQIASLDEVFAIQGMNELNRNERRFLR